MPEITHGRLQPAPGAADRPRRPVGRAQRAAAARRSARRRRSPSSRTPPSRWAPARAASPTSRSAARPRSAATCARRRASETPARRPAGRAARARRAGALHRRRRRAHRAGRGLPRRRAPPGGSCSTSSSPTRGRRERRACAAPTPTPTRSCASAPPASAASCASPSRAPGPIAVRSRAVEGALAGGADAAAAAERVLDDVTPHDDALASSWYRSRTLPVLVRRALDDLQLKENDETHGQRHRARRGRAPAHHPAARPARGALRHQPEGGLPAGRLRRLHGARRRRAAARVPARRWPPSRARAITTVEGLGERRRALRRSRPPSTSTTPRSAASAPRAS